MSPVYRFEEWGSPPAIDHSISITGNCTHPVAIQSPEKSAVTGCGFASRTESGFAGDDRSLQVIDTSSPVERVLIRWLPRKGSSLLDRDGLPRAEILDQIFGSSARQECLRVATVPPPMEMAMQIFGEDAGRRARDTESMRWINFRPAEKQSWWVDVAGVSGLFTSEAGARAPRSLPQETVPASSIETIPGPLPSSHCSTSEPVSTASSRPPNSQPSMPSMHHDHCSPAASDGSSQRVTDSGWW